MSARLALWCAFPALILATAILWGESPLQSEVDSIFSPLVGQDSPGIAVLVRSHGRTLLSRGYGVRHLSTHTRIDAVTNFRLASVSKQFTATAIMLLVHDGKLRYDSTISDIFPDFPAYGRAITVRHLLNHTSGLADYEDLMQAAESGQRQRWTATHQIQDHEVLELLKRQTAGKFAAGTRWSYSNSGYVLLGLIVAKASGEPFSEFLRKRIFEPLQMNETVAWVKDRYEIHNRAYGYKSAGHGFIANDQSPTSATLGDGGVYSNLTDLAKWDEALEKRELLSEPEMQIAFAPATLVNGTQPVWPSEPGEDNLAPGKPVAYGFGWFLDPWRGHDRTWHFGSTSGFRTAIHRFTRDGVTIVVLSNRTDLDANELALRVAEVVLGGHGSR